MLLPIHIAFLHLIIDPACSVVFEAEPAEIDVMRRPPRDPKQPLFNHSTLGLSVLQGAIVLVILLIIFVIALYRGQGEAEPTKSKRPLRETIAPTSADLCVAANITAALPASTPK